MPLAQRAKAAAVAAPKVGWRGAGDPTGIQKRPPTAPPRAGPYSLRTLPTARTMCRSPSG